MERQKKIKPLGLRAKILSIIAVSVVSPLVTGTLITWFMGSHAYQRERGALFQTVAVHYAMSINNALEGHARSLQEWTALSRLPQTLAEATRGPPPDVELLEEDIDYWEARWPGRGDDLGPIQPFLTNDVARLAKAFQAANPQFAEILVTDPDGRLIGASGRTEDYYQADEAWWSRPMGRPGRQVWVGGVERDESADVMSVDMALVVFDPHRRHRPVGMVKGVLAAVPVAGSLFPLLGQAQPISQVVLPDGQVLTRRFDLHKKDEEVKLPPEVMATMRTDGVGWKVMSLTGESRELVGFASLRKSRSFGGRIRFSADRESEVFVTVHEDFKQVRAMVRRAIRIITGAGGLLIVIVGMLGVLVATRSIVSPLQVLRAAAGSISATARLAEDEEEGDRAEDEHSEEQARAMVERVGTIRTGDEIEDLAVEFQRMADRVLNYHVQLQRELTHKTEELQRDLAIAREFQEALLPKTYPEVPARGAEAPLSLGFAHRYRAALSVGGDFFYISRLTDHRAAIFITDVMGHGVRSALVTAILRTLLHNLEPTLDEASSIMSYINRQFCESVPHGKEFIFATAFCLVIDTASGEATCASAGHPSALRSGSANREVVPVMTTHDVGPALGLTMEADYPAVRLKVKPGDLFLLYTDGLIEAPNTQNEAFEEERLRMVTAARRDATPDEVCDGVVQAVARHMDTVVAPDDLCLAAIKVLANHRGKSQG